MAVPTQNVQVTPKHEVAIPVVEQKVQRCSLCHGSGYVKTFTPWGCPSSAPCSCQSSARASGTGTPSE